MTGGEPLLGAVRSLVDSSERELSASASGMEDQRFVELFEPLYGQLIRRLALVLGSDEDAEDVAQESYLRAYRARNSFDGHDPRAWLYTIGLRLAFNTIRGRRRWLAAIKKVEPKVAQVPSDPDLWNALLTLSQESRAALLLNAVDGYTASEVAQILGVPVGTTSSWIHRAKVALKRDLRTE
jgi:RNA polymerase sigma factor (sigma-70 family)